MPVGFCSYHGCKNVGYVIASKRLLARQQLAAFRIVVNQRFGLGAVGRQALGQHLGRIIDANFLPTRPCLGGTGLDPFNQRVWILSHGAPNATVIDTKDGSIVGTVDLGGAPEQAVTDGKGHLYIDIEDKDNVAVVDAKTLTVTAHYDVSAKGVSGGSGAQDQAVATAGASANSD